jgi:aldehyde:ferredoxin oxidoreductase
LIPLGSRQIYLIFNNSVVAGYPAAGLVRYIVATKSPLTNGIGDNPRRRALASRITQDVRL